MGVFETPILFVVFNRPDLTERVFARIREAAPSRLYVAADGAREGREGEAALVEKTRSLATRVDWPCELKTLFQPQNLGCGKAVSGALHWFFQHEEQGIILEDDCLPHPDFFPFCSQLLERYKDDTEVLSISGNHFLDHALHLPQPYYFSKYVQIWGWATWRRVWQQYRLDLSQHDLTGWEHIIARACPNRFEAEHWKQILRLLREGLIDTWDFQLLFTCWHLGGLHVAPSRNLISNIGYRPDATHTCFDGSLADLATAPLAVGDLKPEKQNWPKVDDLIFYVRFLESMHLTWWAEQVLDPSKKLEGARAETARAKEENRLLQRQLAVQDRQNALLAEKLKELEKRAAKRSFW